MATKGYHSYHGKSKSGRTILIVVLILILLAAIGYLLFQELVVYDEQGQIHLELPWQRENEDADPSPTAFPAAEGRAPWAPAPLPAEGTTPCIAGDGMT